MSIRTYDELEHQVADSIGVRLFTVLAWSPQTRVLRRVHTSHPQDYPVGGEKSVEVASGWLSRCVDDGDPYLGADVQAVRSVFADHELIARLGCGAVVNAPVVDDAGQVLGILNALDAEGAYDRADVDRLVDIASRAGDLLRTKPPRTEEGR